MHFDYKYAQLEDKMQSLLAISSSARLSLQGFVCPHEEYDEEIL